MLLHAQVKGQSNAMRIILTALGSSVVIIMCIFLAWLKFKGMLIYISKGNMHAYTTTT